MLYSSKLRRVCIFQCVQVMRPAQKYIKKLVKCEDLLSADSLRYLLKVGDHVVEHLENLSARYRFVFLPFVDRCFVIIVKYLIKSGTVEHSSLL